MGNMLSCAYKEIIEGIEIVRVIFFLTLNYR